MFIKYCTTKTKLHVVRSSKEFETDRFKKFAANLIDIDTDKYLYIINESVHSMEHHGPNANGDAFPLSEMQDHYHTFINSRVSIDHRDELETGDIFDSTFVAPKISGKGEFGGGAFIENILGVNRERADGLHKDNRIKFDLIAGLMDGDITDTSMGAIVAYTECSIPTCKNIAYTETQYCEHIKGGKNRTIKLADEKDYSVYEICHGVSWFEDSIIVPLHMGGLAGGEGADTGAKIKNIVTKSSIYEERLNQLIETVRKHGSQEDFVMLDTLLDILALSE